MLIELKKKLKRLHYNIETAKLETFHLTNLINKSQNVIQNTKSLNECNKEIELLRIEIKELEAKILPLEILSGMNFNHASSYE